MAYGVVGSDVKELRLEDHPSPSYVARHLPHLRVGLVKLEGWKYRAFAVVFRPDDHKAEFWLALPSYGRVDVSHGNFREDQISLGRVVPIALKSQGQLPAG